MVFLDAFSHAYLSKEFTPYLWSLAENGVSTTVDTVFAFRGIETTVFTGVWPSVHNSWTEFKLAGNTTRTSKIRLLQSIVKALDIMPWDALRAKSRFFVERYLFKRIYKTPNVMPSDAIPYFESTQPSETFEEGSLGEITTIFDVFRKKGIPYVCIEPWIRGDKEVVSKAIKMIKHREANGFWYIKFSHLDHLGHRFGPEPLMFKNQLAEIDNYVGEIVTGLNTKSNTISVLVIADHGMSRVNGTVNILDDMRQLKARMYKDFVVFVDSTLIRFWFFNKKASVEISDMLSQVKCGHILSEEEKKSLDIPLSPEFGELIFVFDEGYIAHPSFFSRRSEVKGMHGYAYPKTCESRPILIANGQIAREVPKDCHIKFIDVSHFILRSFLPNAPKADYGLISYLS